MNQRACRNCGSFQHYQREVVAKGGYGPDLLPIKGFFKSASYRVEVCGDCGLTEWFVPERFLAQVKESFSADDV